MRVILDCDPGIDDTYALIWLTAAAHAGIVELDCVSTTSGNTHAEQCARNAAWVLSLCGLPIVPVAAGCPEPLVCELTTTPETHGETGLGYATALAREVEHDFDALWIDAIERGTDDLHLIVTGPLTNLAAFAEAHPEHYAELKHITVMGGAVNYPGNTTPSAEWNFWVDPHAAADVFAMTPTPVTLCSLGVTERMLLTPMALAELVEKATAAGVDPSQITLDPGLGFAKTPEDNWALLHALPEFVAGEFPVLVGASRKRFLMEIRADRGLEHSPINADPATAAVTALAAHAGAWCVRVHEVAVSRDAVDVARRWTNG